MPDAAAAPRPDMSTLKRQIREWSEELGFQGFGVARPELAGEEQRLQRWLAAGRHGEMHYMARHGTRRSRPSELVPGTVRILSMRMDYLPESQAVARELLDHPSQAYVSRYALGRDYHKVIRRRLQKLAQRIQDTVGNFGYRVFVDSAPVLEKPLARNAGLGWIGKHTNLINRDAGSWFFLGEIFTDLPIPPDAPATDHCGTCRACIDVCPTGAITGPYELDARRCISYLTIELRSSIPEPFRVDIGNRIYGCDDCQLFCPWNKFAATTREPDFAPRHGLDAVSLIEAFRWGEAEWLRRMEGSAIRRIGYECWLRNVAVALGNAETTRAVLDALRMRADSPSALVREHVHWALRRHGQT